MSDPLPTASRDSKVRNRAVAYAYLLGQMAAAQVSPPDDYMHYSARINAWRANAECLALKLGRALTLDMQDTSLHARVTTPWDRRWKREVRYRKYPIYLLGVPPHYGDGRSKWGGK